MDYELQRAISGPVSASIKTMNNSSFLVFDDSIVEEDSDEEDLDRYTDVGLREQLFITLSRAIRSTQNTETKITESAIPDSIKNKRGPQRRKLNPSQSSTKSKSRTHDTIPLTLPKESYSKYNDSHTNHHNNDLQYHEQYNKSKTKTKNNKNSHKYEYKHAAFFNRISPIESSPNHKSIIKHKHRNNNKPKMINNASEPSMITRKDKTHKKKTHKRQQSNIRHYSPRIVGNDMKLNDDTYILDEYDNDNTYKPIPLPNRNKMFPKRSPKIHSTKSDQDIISTLEQVRKDKSEEILQNLPPTSRTPKASNNTDISSRFNVVNNIPIQKQKHSHIHNRSNYKKQVPKHISSRGMPPPPGSNTVTVNRTSKLSRQNTDYNIINPNNILQKKHMKKASSYRDTIPPPPPKTPPPHPKSKSARNRHIYRKYNTHQQQPIQLQTPSYSQTPISKSLGNNNNNNSILGASLQHKPHHKHSYTGIPTLKRNKKPKPNKSPPPAPPPKWMANNNAEIKSKSYSKPIGTYSRNRTRSRSKDSIDIGIITSNVDEYNTHKHNPLYPLPMKQDITGTWISTSKNIPPPPPKQIQQYRHTAPPNLIRNHASSVAITRSSPNYKSMDMNNISDIDEDIPFKLFNKMKNDTKYNTMGPMMFNMNNQTNHAVQYSNSSSIEEKELSISSNVSISATTHSHITNHIPHAYSNSLPSNTTVTVMNSRSSHSPQNSNNSDTHFIPPSPQHIFGNINSNKNRKHRPNAPMQVYSTPPMRNKLEKMKVNTLKSHNISPINYEIIPTNVIVSPRGNNNNIISLNTAVVLDPISDNDSENSIHINNTPLSPLSQLGPLQDKENEDDDDDDDGICTITPTRMRSNNMFTIKVSDAASDNEIEIDEKYNYNKSSIDSDDDIGHSDIPMALPEWLSASEYLLCDPTLDPKRNLKNKLNKNPVKNIRARGATWIGKTSDNKHGLKRYVVPLKSNKKNGKIKKLPTIGLSPSTTTTAFGSLMKDRTDSLADRFKGVQLKDGHIVLNTKETQLETVNIQFQKGMPDFQDIHQKFATEFANKIFDGHLKSYQRAFMPISPQHLGLVDFSNIRSRRRAVFGGKLGPSKGFYDGETVMDISIEKRNIMIGKYIAKVEFQKQKRYKKSFGKETPKRKKKYKYSETYTSTTSSSYSLSIAADISLSSSHVAHKSTSSILTPSTSYQLYPEHYHYDVVHLDNGKHKNKNKKTWQKLLSFGKKKKGKKRRKSTDLIIDDYKSLTLDDPSDVTANRVNSSGGNINISKTKDDMLYGSMPLNGIGFEINGFDYTNAMYKTDYEINQITQNISANKLRRGDLILIMDYEHIDVENENLHSFISKYKIDNFLKRMEEEENKRKDALEIVRQRSAMRLLSKQRSFLKQPSNSNDNINDDINNTLNGYYSPPLKPINRPRAKEMIDINQQELQDIQILEEWKNKQGAAHCMIVLQNIGNSIEVAHVTSAGGTRSFIKNFDADTIAQTLYLRTKKEAKLKNINNRYNINRDTNTIHENTQYIYNDRQRSNTAQSTKIVEALGRGPPVAYRCVVYRLNTDIVSAKKFANEAANVAENLVKGGRVLGDPAVFAGSMERYIENPEKYFYRFLLSSNASLFRRVVRLHFDEGTSFFNFSSSEFVSLCFQRALVNKKSFDRQLIRLLDCCPHLTPPTLLQKYIHLNIDEHGDWLCLGNVFFSYL